MRAPVYRHLDAKSSLFGLAFPSEWTVVLCAAWLGSTLGAPNGGAAAGLAIYLVLRVFVHGRPDGHLRHWIAWRILQATARGRLSAAARAPSPRFPWASYEWRDPSAPSARP